MPLQQKPETGLQLSLQLSLLLLLLLSRESLLHLDFDLRIVGPVQRAQKTEMGLVGREGVGMIAAEEFLLLEMAVVGEVPSVA